MNTVMEMAEVKKSIGLSNIALATDFSEASVRAFKYAVSLAGSYGAKLHVVHAIPTESSLVPTLVEHDQLQRESEEKMHEFSGRSELQGLVHDELVRPGTVWSVVSELIHGKNIDLLVVGTHGRGGLKKVMLGSAAEEIVRLAPCPVLTVGPNTPAPSGVRCEFRSVLFATGFGAASEKALPYALFFAERCGAKLVLLHVLPPTPFPTAGVGPKAYARIEEWRAQQTTEITQQLGALLPVDTKLASAPEYVVRFDLLFQGILSAAAEYSPDLIVMGAKRAISSKAMAHLPWTVAHEVMCHATSPVLTVRL